MVLELRPVTDVASCWRIDAARFFAAIASGQTQTQLRAVQVLVGAQLVEAGAVFEWRGSFAESEPAVTATGDWSRVDGVGAGWGRGALVVQSAVGHRAGLKMTGGRVSIHGDAGDDAGQGMAGGQLLVDGDAGDRVGGPLAGRIAGNNRGVIVIGGQAGRCAGWRMRRGTIAIKQSCAELAGYELRGGNLLIGGTAGSFLGQDCRRGLIAVFGPRPEIHGGYRHNGRYIPEVLRLLAQEPGLRNFFALPDSNPPWDNFSGDFLHGGKGELWVACSASS